jgi:hypothetical protein
MKDQSVSCQTLFKGPDRTRKIRIKPNRDHQKINPLYNKLRFPRTPKLPIPRNEKCEIIYLRQFAENEPAEIGNSDTGHPNMSRL